MTTFQAVAYGIIRGFSEFLPISSSAHERLVSYFLNWQLPADAFSGALALGALLAVLIYFRHDWASMISCFLQVILFRKKPMTLDERMPIFLAIATLPAFGCWYYFSTHPIELQWNPFFIPFLLVGFALPLWISESASRKTKGMFDWNGLDSFIVGIFQTSLLIPGGGQITGALIGAMLRNYQREAAVKFALYAMAPTLAAQSFLNLKKISLHSGAPMSDLSWLSFGVALVVTVFSSLLAIGGLMRQVQRKGIRTYVGYRVLIAVSLGCLIWIKSRG